MLEKSGQDALDAVDAFFAKTRRGLEPSAPRAQHTAMANEEPDLRIQISEARTDAKFERMLGEMRVGFAQMGERLDGVQRAASGLKPTIIGTGIGIAAIILTALAYGQQLFGNGFAVDAVARSAVSEYVAQHPQPQAPSAPARP